MAVREKGGHRICNFTYLILYTQQLYIYNINKINLLRLNNTSLYLVQTYDAYKLYNSIEYHIC